MTAQVWQAAEVPIEHEVLPDAGGQTAGSADLGPFGAGSFGVWEIETGVSTDVEADEVAVVLSGRGSVEDLDTGAVVDLAPGTILRLTAGTRTRWTITERLRKAYVVG
ncbi:cupin domain-containing protein [uncultured Amnibacterium sp.]|uniref:cupin domain-containing protein n=1 Tax=uncultured Amnibacterium sp. TaxID=1631851 RepID=UPI0035CC9506